MRLTLAAPLAALALGTLGCPAAQAAPPGFPDIDRFDAATWNNYLAGGEDVQTVHLEFRTPSGLDCFIHVDAFDFECWGPLHGAPGGANHVRTNFVDRQPAPELDELKLLPDHTKISWRGVTCGVDGPLTACYQVNRGFATDDKETKVFPYEPPNGEPVLDDPIAAPATSAPAAPATSAPAAPSSSAPVPTFAAPSPTTPPPAVSSTPAPPHRHTGPSLPLSGGENETSNLGL